MLTCPWPWPFFPQFEQWWLLASDGVRTFRADSTEGCRQSGRPSSGRDFGVVLEVQCHRGPLIQGEYLGNPADNLHGNNHIGFMFQQIGHLTESHTSRSCLVIGLLACGPRTFHPCGGAPWLRRDSYWLPVTISLSLRLLSNFPSRACSSGILVSPSRSACLEVSLYSPPQSWAWIVTADTCPLALTQM